MNFHTSISFHFLPIQASTSIPTMTLLHQIVFSNTISFYFRTFDVITLISNLVIFSTKKFIYSDISRDSITIHLRLSHSFPTIATVHHLFEISVSRKSMGSIFESTIKPLDRLHYLL